MVYKGKKTSVRLIGIEAFETTQGKRLVKQATTNNISTNEALKRGKRAKKFLEKKISNKRKEKNKIIIWLEFDEKRYDNARLLAYVFLRKNDRIKDMLNIVLVREGMAKDRPYGEINLKYRNRLAQAAEKSKKK